MADKDLKPASEIISNVSSGEYIDMISESGDSLTGRVYFTDKGIKVDIKGMWVVQHILREDFNKWRFRKL